MRISGFAIDPPCNWAGRKTRNGVSNMMSLFTRRKVIGLFRLVGLAVPFKFSPLLAAETQVPTNTSDVHLLSQDARPPASVPLQDARLCGPASNRPRSDSKLPNVNWVRGRSEERRVGKEGSAGGVTDPQ